MHTIVSAAEDLLDKPIAVLDHGYVTLVDYMGGDLRVAQAAWLDRANSKGSNDEAAQAAVINYMMKNKHTSPFEQVVLTFEIMMPMREMRQHVRHRTARLNEFSGRYQEIPELYHSFSAQDIRAQSKKNHQGRSDDTVPYAEGFASDQLELMEAAFSLYREMIAAGVAKEIARSHLPLATYTKIIWQMDLHNLLHFLLLRLDAHAQEEIRAYAVPILACTRAVAPLSVAAWEEHVRYAKTFSKTEWEKYDDGK